MSSKEAKDKEDKANDEALMAEQKRQEAESKEKAAEELLEDVKQQRKETGGLFSPDYDGPRPPSVGPYARIIDEASIERGFALSGKTFKNSQSFKNSLERELKKLNTHPTNR